MNARNLNPLFAPRSIAVIGASSRAGGVGTVVFRNILDGGFHGTVYAVNPNHDTVLGQRSFPSIAEIPDAPDLAVIVTPAPTVPGIIEACGKRGVPAALIISAGFADAGTQGQSLQQAVVANAKRANMRILGPNCLGIMRASVGLNATFANSRLRAGNIGIIAQSGALCTAILDWADDNDVAFSSMISLGNAADVDFGEILDYLATDSKTESILLYIEGLRDARSFMSALRAAARIKPVIVAKSGRHEAGRKAAMTHSGAMVGADDVFDAALARAGVVRVKTFTQLFSAARCLSSRYRPCGDRLAIVTNGGGAGVIAADWAADVGIKTPELSLETLNKLEAALPSNWSRGNPVDIIGDAPPERYRAAVRACLEDRGIDGVLAILTPQAMTRPLEAANAVIELCKEFSKPVVACWMGESQVAAARSAFIHAKIPVFRTPEPAVEAFSHISAHYRNQQLLMQVPPPHSHEDEPDRDGARIVVETALAEKRPVLSEVESKALLAAFRIPVTNTSIARNAAEAVVIAEQTGFPLAMKIHSRDISHKSDVGGVRLNINNAQEARTAFNEILAQVKTSRPEARIDGVSIQPMSNKPHGRELLVGVATDPVFGPVISFGAGGIMVEAIGDRVVALPPLNHFLARDMIVRTRVSRILGAFRNLPPINMEALESVLLRVSEMVCELPGLREMDVNPLIVDEQGALAVDARVVVDRHRFDGSRPYGHMAIHPYPAKLIETVALLDGIDVAIRPIRPEDAALVQDLVGRLSEATRYFRFMEMLRELSPGMLARFTQIDYDREMALVGIVSEGGSPAIIGVARYAMNLDGESCEFALVVADAWQNKGLGSKLMQSLMNAARVRGLKTIHGDVLSVNADMLRLMANLGFSVAACDDDPAVKRVSKDL